MFSMKARSPALKGGELHFLKRCLRQYKEVHEIVDTEKDIVPQVQRIVIRKENLGHSLLSKTTGNK
ncbi:MAG: hypothetical protein H8D67_21590 [Deltaproteobacteria bacterium]|nr:hypothetical protein [Deltaproteobacteria bacterium]